MEVIRMAYSVDVEKARKFALHAHTGRVDKAGMPYAGHLERVAGRLMDDPATAVVAWLHDTVEDTGVTLDLIRSEFGEETAAAVEAITHRPGEDYMEYVKRAGEHPFARKVKISDLIDNSNLSRLPNVTMKDVNRQKKYNVALSYLMSL